jgi:hypothetical protein
MEVVNTFGILATLSWKLAIDCVPYLDISEELIGDPSLQGCLSGGEKGT